MRDDTHLVGRLLILAVQADIMRGMSYDYDSELYYYTKARVDYPEKSEETTLKHQKSKKKFDRRSRSGSKLSNRSHQNSSGERDFSEDGRI